MKTLPPIVKLQSLFSITAAATMLCGCALTKDYVGVAYKPQDAVAKVPGAESASVSVTATDTRSVRDRVGSKKNGYGMEMAEIISTNDVVRVISDAIETELKQRGFNVASGGTQVVLEINKCLNDFKAHFWSGDAIAEIVMNVQVKKADGSIIYTRLVSATGENMGIQLASGKNAQIAIERALQNSVRILMEDKQFLDAIIAANKPAATASR